jgi:hypothetical protein
VDSEPENYVLNQLGQEIDYEKDTDEDGLPDWFEKELGTNSNKVDTDEDGLPDGYEYFILETDPLKVDSDNNGILDGDEDNDEDGLTNIKEYESETNPFIADTDEDGFFCVICNTNFSIKSLSPITSYFKVNCVVCILHFLLSN